MARIKTALELALEKASKIDVDTNALRVRELEKIAGQLAVKLQDEVDFNLELEMKKFDKNEKKQILNSINKILSSYLHLSDLYNEIQIKPVLNAFTKIKSKPKKVEPVLNDIEYVLSTYSTQLKQLVQQLKEQFEQQINQLGIAMETDVTQHPEFMKYLTEAKKNLDEQFEVHLKQLKEALNKIENI